MYILAGLHKNLLKSDGTYNKQKIHNDGQNQPSFTEVDPILKVIFIL